MTLSHSIPFDPLPFTNPPSFFGVWLIFENQCRSIWKFENLKIKNSFCIPSVNSSFSLPTVNTLRPLQKARFWNKPVLEKNDRFGPPNLLARINRFSKKMRFGAKKMHIWRSNIRVRPPCEHLFCVIFDALSICEHCETWKYKSDELEHVFWTFLRFSLDFIAIWYACFLIISADIWGIFTRFFAMSIQCTIVRRVQKSDL